MRFAMLRGLAIGVLAMIAAGCTGPGPAGLELQAGAPAQTATALAFEPVTGIPEERTAVLAEALVSGAIERGLVVVPRETDRATFRLKGYFSAARAGGRTDISFAWDVFDAAENRVHRIAGIESVQAGVPDPWQAVTDDALRRIAQRTVEGLEAWLARGAPETAGLDDVPTDPARLAEMPGEPALPSETVADAVTALVARPATAPPAPSAGARARVYIAEIAGAVGDGAAALAEAMARRLRGAGLEPAPHPADADYVVSAEATVGPVQDDTRAVAIIWSVARSDGADLGTVRQVRHVGAGALDAGWGASADAAAGAAAPGIVSLLHAP